MPASLPSAVGGTRSILLVEEYAALASAIGSALKKFAPEHQTHVAKSFAEAAIAAAEVEPELVVVDFDPPQPGAIAFFEALRAKLPNSRVLVLGADSSPEVLQARHKPAAFTFVDKPFDLAAFGAAVRKVIAPPSSQSATDGTLRDLGLADLLPLLCAAGATAVIEVEAMIGRTGEIHLASGQIVHAETDEQIGTPALATMMRWRAVRMAEADRAPTTERTIQQSWSTVLAEAMRKSNVTRARRASTKQKPTGGAAEPPKKLVIIDDTELLLIFVEDVLATADATWEIVTASTGAEGVERVTAILPDAVLLDFSLPDITGDEVCRRLLADQKTAGIPIVMMSGHVPEMTSTAARFENVIATIAKPFLSHALVDLVRKTLTSPAPRRRKVATPASSEPQLAPTVEPKAPAPVSSPPPSQAEPSSPSASDENGHRTVEPPLPEPALRPESISRAARIEPEPRQEPQPAASQPAPRHVEPPPARAIPTPPRFEAPVALTAPTAIIWPSASRLAPESSGGTPPAAPEIAEAGVAVRIPTASSNAVVLGFALQVVSMQFSPSLQMAAIRARPWSRTVSLHIHPQALPGVALPEAGFELGRIDLDTRGHMATVRLTPTAGAPAKPPLRDAFPVADVAVLPASGGKTMELTPASMAPMTMQLFASFDLAGVELSATFGIGSLVLKSRGADLRATLSQGGPSTGATFRNAQVLLDRSSRIAEILLDSVA